MSKYIIFETNGGIGKSIMSSAVVEAMKKQYPDWEIIVVGAYPEIFLNNPHVHRALPQGTMYFWETYVKDKEVKIFRLEPYMTEAFVKQEKHLIEIWCDLFGIKYNGEQPKIYLTDFEIERAKRTFIKDKPILVIQPFGGADPKLPYSWNRDIPMKQAEEIVYIHKGKYEIYQIGRQDQPTVKGAQKVTLPYREIASLIAVADKLILIDSFGQHTAKALGKKATVLWITNSPKVFGYETHENIMARPIENRVRAIHAYLEEFDFSGHRLEQNPYKNDDVFELTKI